MPEQAFINTDIFSIRQFFLRQKIRTSFPRLYITISFSPAFAPAEAGIRSSPRQNFSDKTPFRGFKPMISPDFTGTLSHCFTWNIWYLFAIKARKPQRHNTDKSRSFALSAIRNHSFLDDFWFSLHTLLAFPEILSDWFFRNRASISRPYNWTENKDFFILCRMIQPLYFFWFYRHFIPLFHVKQFRMFSDIA